MNRRQYNNFTYKTPKTMDFPQGSQFLAYQKSKISNQNVDLTSDPMGLDNKSHYSTPTCLQNKTSMLPNETLIENFEGILPAPQTTATNYKDQSQGNSLIKEFNTASEKFNTDYQNFILAIQQFTQSNPSSNPYVGKNVQLNDGSNTIGYVTNGGFFRKYPTNVWNKIQNTKKKEAEAKQLAYQAKIARQSSSQGNYTQFNGDCPGNNISVTSQSLDNCKITCDNNDACKGISYYNGTCIPKNQSCTTASPSPWTFYQKNSSSSPVESKIAMIAKAAAEGAAAGLATSQSTSTPVPLQPLSTGNDDIQLAPGKIARQPVTKMKNCPTTINSNIDYTKSSGLISKYTNTSDSSASPIFSSYQGDMKWGTICDEDKEKSKNTYLLELAYAVSKLKTEMQTSKVSYEKAASKLKVAMDKSKITDDRLTRQLAVNIEKAKKEILEYDQVIFNLKKETQEVDTILGQAETSDLEMVSENYKYLIWSILAIVVVGASIKIVRR